MDNKAGRDSENSVLGISGKLLVWCSSRNGFFQVTKTCPTLSVETRSGQVIRNKRIPSHSTAVDARATGGIECVAVYAAGTKKRDQTDLGRRDKPVCG